MNNAKQMKGFSLIELLITIAIIGILAAIVAPMYSDYVTEAKRSDAKIALQETAQSLERCMTLFGAYNSASCTVAFPLTSPEGLYSLTAPTRGASTFSLTATPVAGRSQANDAECTTFTLANTGAKGATGSNPNVCW